MRDARRRDWGWFSQSLHWITLVLIVWLAWLGLTMTDLPNSPHKIQTFALHKSLGLTVLALTLLRLLWRMLRGAPPPEPQASPWQTRVAWLTHAAIYILLFAIPLSGWWFNSVAGYPLRWFNTLKIPALTARTPALRDSALNVHTWLFWSLIALVALHVLAALYHHFIVRDHTLQRMLPGRART